MIEVKKEHLALDRAHLEQAILNQASWFDLYASECARQQSKVDRLKNQLEYVSAEKKIAIRANAAASGGKAPTQDQVDCQLIVDPDIKLLKDSLLEEEEYLGQLKAAVEAMRHKRDSIENERALVLSKFTMDGDVSPEIREQARLDAIEKATQESMHRKAEISA
jgi:hypothetical protein